MGPGRDPCGLLGYALAPAGLEACRTWSRRVVSSRVGHGGGSLYHPGLPAPRRRLSLGLSTEPRASRAAGAPLLLLDAWYLPRGLRAIAATAGLKFVRGHKCRPSPKLRYTLCSQFFFFFFKPFSFYICPFKKQTHLCCTYTWSNFLVSIFHVALFLCTHPPIYYSLKNGSVFLHTHNYIQVTHRHVYMQLYMYSHIVAFGTLIF